ncbi:MAG TPA: ABC transporter permease [Acidobacteriaceae bacterium]
MSWLGWLRARVGRSQGNDAIDDELRSHIQHRADDLERSGMPRAEAERRARVEFGGYEHYREESYDAVGSHFFERLAQDVRYGLRVLGKSPGFTVTAMVTLALAIGANAVVFSLLNGLVLRPLNVPGAERLVTIEQRDDGSPPVQSYPDYLDLRERNRSFEDVVAYQISRAGLDTGGHAVPVWLYEASGNYFDALRVQPYMGRFFHESDQHGENSSPYIVLSYAYWQSHFAADPGVVGRAVRLNKHPYTILGVAAREFRGTELFFTPDFWVPLVDQEQVDGWSMLKSRTGRGTEVIGILKPVVTPAQASADLDAVAAYLKKTYPKEDDSIGFKLARPGLAGDMLGGPVRAFLGGLMALAVLILLAACANLGSLFASRTADRSKEVALRLALGSSRRRILRQLLTEAIMISLAGGTMGLAGSVALLRWLSAWQPLTTFPVRVPVNPDAHVYWLALLLAVVSGLLFGIVPVRQVFRANPYEVVKAGSSIGMARRFTARDLLLAAQIAICALLVTASLVAVRGLARSLKSNFGFEPRGVMLVDTDLDMAGYSGDKVAPMQRKLIDTVSTIPGVSAAGIVDRPPLSLGWSTDAVFKDSVTDMRMSNATADAANFRISPGYFRAAGTVFLAGRDFSWQDDKNSLRVAIVNEEFARKLFGTTSGAVGGYFRADGVRIRVVGLIEDGKYKSLTEDAQPAMFFPILQVSTSSTALIVRSNGDSEQLGAALQDTISKLDRGLPFTIKSWTRELDAVLFPSRVATISLGVLGLLGAMLAVTGIFGMAAYSVSKRLRELGIRIALGAQRREVLGAALGRAFRLLAYGSAAGLALGLAATRVLSYVVYQASPRDPLVLGGVVAVMLLLGVLAAWIPAQRALKADPLALLREE